MNTTTHLAPASGLLRVPLNTQAVRDAVHSQGVVHLDVQGMTTHGFADFMATLGEPMFTKGETPVEGLPDLNVVTNVGRTTKPKSVFHSDTTYVARPPSYAGLFAVEVPDEGGATVFVDQYDAYTRLPSELARLLDGATMIHSATGVSLDEADEKTARHPVVRTHPDTGRKAIFITTPARCSSLKLANGVERSDLIIPLYEHSLEHGGRRTHHWLKGDVIVWDNRCTLHAADHSAVVGNRTLFRALVKGEMPF